MAQVRERLYPAQILVADHRRKSVQETAAPTAQARIKGRLEDGQSTYQVYQSIILDFKMQENPHAHTKKASAGGKFRAQILSKANEAIPPDEPYGRQSWAYLQILQVSEPALAMLPLHHEKYAVRPTYGPAASEIELRNIRPSSPIEANITDGQIQIAIAPAFEGLTGDHDVACEIDLKSSKPYIDWIWEDVVPVAAPQFPLSGAFVDDASNVGFGWSYNGGRSYDGTYNQQKQAVFEWRVQGESQVHQAAPITGPVWQINIPAGTFPAKTNLEWRVLITSEFGATAEIAWQPFTTTDSTPQAPDQLDPDLVRVDNNAPVELRWKYRTATGSPQTKAEVQYSTDEGSSWLALKTVPGAASSCTIPANGLPTGQIWWRVRAANTDGVWSAWSQPAKIIVRSAPAAPVITGVTTTPRPVVSWQHADQQGYRVTITAADGTTFDTGTQYGSAKECKCTNYLPDGLAVVTVSAINAIGLSNQSSVTVQIQNKHSAPAEINLSCAAVHGMARLRWSGSGFNRYYILRNGKPIAVTTGADYEDKLSAGRPEYQVMGVYGENADFYCVSRKAPLPLTCKDTILVDMETGAAHYLRLHRDSPPQINRSMEALVEYHHFAGAAHPKATAAGMITEGVTLEYTVRHDELDAVRAMIGHKVCIKTREGKATFAVLESVSQNVWKRADVSLQLTAIDYEEVVPYV